ncbi:hypothetical protein [Methylovirgula sp. 4M-Z18]|uniref:hypothetical protein n=1 Tax=Methylovirgula sp. 4M-Z18 TaxID=2293567 RepID=UPI000E2F90B1|nr:hypothetical protein [Methylovirgula sp. 4M-Z18]RFB80345.1 hypothetical protein DYH55_02125 [Methylovirgula sp. 4M-Z18]
MPRRSSPLHIRPREDTIPTEYFILADLHVAGPIVGRFNDKPIHEEVVGDDGRHYRFAGVMPRRRNGKYAVETLRRDEWIVDPGLIYMFEK